MNVSDRTRNIINTTALVVFVWLVVSALRIPDMLLSFLILGEIPFIEKSLPPNFMLFMMSTAFILVVFELLARRYKTIHEIKSKFLAIFKKRTVS